ncbi:helix-turn-helix domain-containing protein [Mucilaginibacter sp. SP1R1]|uniref:helix-turn-helix domain-containing protein n=1 Tax=Mucilaginibacter sp. SP1R1 TaxID=2723091 RepID=UPI0017F1153E|nr:transcriptional regulator with XRE-family HTH domain [Mucilaginibacter sp. SP1R1]
MINIKNVKLIKTFGERLRELRISERLSQEELANLADIPISQVGRIERGENNPTLSTIGALAAALKVSINSFFESKDQN